MRAGRKFGKTYAAVRVARDWACDADAGAYVLVAAPEYAYLRDQLVPEMEARKRFSAMAAHGLKDSLMKGDVKGAFKNVGKDLGMHAANTLATKAADKLTNVLSGALSMIPGIGGLFSFFGFQREGLVTRPTLAMVGEREPEFVVTQERMRALMSGGRSGYGFGPGDFGAPNVSVASPNVNVEVSVAPGVDADIQTAYRARAGEARLSQLEG